MEKELNFNTINWAGNFLDCLVIDKKDVYVITKWNGEKWLDCWQVDTTNHEIIDDNLEITPIYKEIDEDIYKVVDVIINKK